MQIKAVGASSQNEVLITTLYDGTAPFNDGLTAGYPDDPLGSDTPQGAPELHTPGQDKAVLNGVIRTFDTYAMSVSWNVNEDSATGVTITVELPDHGEFAPDNSGMFAGCDRTLSAISADRHTLTCVLGDVPEGSNGTIRPVVRQGFADDGTVFDVSATLTTDSDPAGVTDLSTPLTVSEAPVVDWVKQAPEFGDPVDTTGDGNVDGVVYLYPLTLVDYYQNSTPVLGMGPILDSEPLNLFDHAFGLTDNATLATQAQLDAATGGGRTVCGAYDGVGDAYPITSGTWTCGAVTSPNGYPVVPLTVTGHTTIPAPEFMSDGVTPNDGPSTLFPDGVKRTGPFVVTGQIAFYLPIAEYEAEVADPANDSATSAEFFNGVTPQDASVAISSPGDVSSNLIPGNGGLTDELSSGNNTRSTLGGNAPPPGTTSPGATIGHNIQFLPGPLALHETNQWSPSRIGADMRNTSVGGNGFLPGAGQDHGNSDRGDYIGTTSRGATVTVATSVLVNGGTLGGGTRYDAPIHGCTAFDTAHYNISAYDSPIVVTETDAASTNVVQSVYGVPSNGGPLAHVVTGMEGRSSFGSLNALGGQELPFEVQFTDAPIEYHSGTSFGVEDDGLTCNDSDAGPSGWVDGTGDLSVFDTGNPGDGIYEGITRARVRITEHFSWESVSNGGRYRGFLAFFQAQVKTDLTINRTGQELFAVQSHSFGDLGPDGAPDLVRFPGDTNTAQWCSPYSGKNWRANGNAPNTATGWCNNRFEDDGVDSFDTSDTIDWDNNSWTDRRINGAGESLYQNASGTVISIVGARLALAKENVDGLGDVKDNGQLVQFRMTPRIVGSDREALYNVRLSDNLPQYYEFVRFVSQPTTPGSSCQPPPTPTGTINCQFSEPDPAVDTGPLPAALAGGWSDEFIIEVRVTGAVAHPTTPTVLTNQATLRSSGVGAWDPNTEAFTGTLTPANTAVSDRAHSFMPLPADGAAIVKVVDALEGPCELLADGAAATPEWEERCSLVGHDDNMSFLLSLTNTGNSDITEVEFVDVFPHNADGTEPASHTGTQGVDAPTVGDGRNPASSYTGTLGFVSATPGPNFPAGATLTTWVTGDDPLTVSRDPDAALDATTGTTWCDTPGGTPVGGVLSGTCPADASEVTAAYSRVTDMDLFPNQALDPLFTLDNEDSTCNDLYTNTFGARVGGVLLPIRSNDVSVMITCDLDLALEKALDPTFVPGTDWATQGTTVVPFLVEVTNQGDPIEDFDVTDYVDITTWKFDVANNPAGDTTGSAALPYSWDVTDPAKPVVSVDGRLDDNESVVIPVNLTLVGAAADMVNVAEISYFDTNGDPSDGDSDPDNPNNPATGALVDVDSNPDDTDGNGPGEDPDVDMVDGETDEDGSNGGDEDDHDIATIPIYDLSLIKTVAGPVDMSTTPPTGKFTIEVSNEGNRDVYGVEVTEYIPTGLSMNTASTDASLPPGITRTSGSTFLIAGPIAPGGSASFDLHFNVDNIEASPYRNAAEISAFDNNADPTDPLPALVVDVDSTPDGDNDDEVIDQTAKNYDPDNDDDLNEATPGDEDDHDIAVLELPFDLAIRKRVDPTDPELKGGLQNGEVITFYLEVFNQGRDVEDFDVIDYIGAGWNFDEDENPGGITKPGSLDGPELPFTWDLGGIDPVSVVDGELATNESVLIPIHLTVAIASTNDPLFNSAEILRFDSDGDSSNGDSDPNNPNNPDTGPLVDVDSTPDGVDGNDTAVDDVIDNTDDDEDDHDFASTKWYDLALVKDLSDGESRVIDLDDTDVSFDITVSNQGPEPVTAVSVTDTPPTGLTYSALNPATFTDPVSGAIVTCDGDNTFTIDQLDPGETATFAVIYDIDLAATVSTELENTAEIDSFADIDGDKATDIDSVPNANPDDDRYVDGEADPEGDGGEDVNADTDNDGSLHNGNQVDEDDHDREVIIFPFDLALVKTPVKVSTPLVPGGQVTMNLTVINQGARVETIDIVDYLDPALWAPFDATLNPDGPVGADSSAAAAYRFTWGGTAQAPIATLTPETPGETLAVGETLVVPIVLTVADDFDTSVPLINTAEISNFDDDGDPTNGDADPDNPNNPDTGPLVDRDSTPDDTNESSGGETVDGDLVDNATDGDGRNGGDEDDHDVAVIPVYDAALRKSVDPSTSFPVFIGSSVTFQIEIFNQGTVDITDPSVIDYLDADMWAAFNPSDNRAGTTGGDAKLAYTWAAAGTNAALTVTGTLKPGQSITAPITLQVASGADLSKLSNTAEITGGTPTRNGQTVTDPDGEPIVDADSTPDTDNSDPLVDNEINSHGADGDEDDHDVAQVEPPTYHLGNQVWFDADNNGILDPDEAPVAGVVVDLFTDADNDGEPDDTNGDGIIDANDAIASVTTGAEGDYLFKDLAAAPT